MSWRGSDQIKSATKSANRQDTVRPGAHTVVNSATEAGRHRLSKKESEGKILNLLDFTCKAFIIHNCKFFTNTF